MATQIQERLEKDIASLLVHKLEDQQITSERAQEISKFVLKSLPENLTDEQLLGILPKLDDTFIELATIVNTYLHEYNEIHKKHVELEAELLIKKGKLNDANALMREFFTK